MKNKSLVKTLFWILFLACSFQFTLMIPSSIIEQNVAQQAANYAANFPIELQVEKQELYLQNYLDSISNQVVFSIPYVADYTYQDLKNQQLQLGLDLKGGMQVTIALDKEMLLKNLVADADNPTFLKALTQTKESISISEKEYISVFVDNYLTLTDKANVLQQFNLHPQLKDAIDTKTSISALNTALLNLSEELTTNTKYLLEQRINSHGLAETRISGNLEAQHILIEIPGAKNPERVRNILMATANLEFWETYSIDDNGILEGLKAANRMLK